MKKWMMYLCVGAMALGLAACGNQEDAGNSTEPGTQEGTTVPGGSAAQESTGTVEGPGDVFSGWSEEMATLRAAVMEELGDDYWPNMEIPAELLEMSYGLTPDMYEDYMGEMPMMSVHVDTLLIVKAAEGQADAVEQALRAYHKDLAENSSQYPMNLGKVQAGIVERMDDYVYFVLLGGDTTAVEEQGDAAVIAHCQEQNQRVIEIIKENLNQ